MDNKEQNNAEVNSLPDGIKPISAEEEFLSDSLTHTGTIEISLINPVHKGFKINSYLFIKRIFDILGSSFFIILLSPLFLFLFLAEKCTTKGSAIYKHKRLGYRGKTISVLKFRSMNDDKRPLEQILTPEQLEQYKTEFKIENDPRITKLGKFLRKTSLDELPQLFNIFIGNMSFVGPRPIVYKEIKTYYKHNARQLLGVKPGMTGYWQAYGRNTITYTSGKRQAMELFYVNNRSLWLDIKILFKTVSSVISHKGAE